MHRGMKGHQKRQLAQCGPRIMSEEDIHQESLHTSPHQCWPLFPQKPV